MPARRAGGLRPDDDEARPVARLILDAAGEDGQSGQIGQTAVADGRRAGLALRPPGRGSRGFHRHQSGIGQVRPQPAAALGQRLRMGVDGAHLGQRGRVAQQAMGDAREEFGLDVHVVAQEKVEAHAHGALEGVLQRHDAQLALPPGHFFKDLRQIVAGMEDGRVPQIFHARKIGEGAFRAEVGHMLRALQRARGGQDLAPDGAQVAVGQRARVLPGQIVQHFALTQGLEDDAGIVGLDPSHFEAEGGPLVEQGQQAAVHLLDAGADLGQTAGGCSGGRRRGIRHARPP